jgi:cation transport regulator
MPYKDISDLPDRIRENLPVEAQKIYLKTFNSAFLEYQDPKKRKDDSSSEVIAHKVAWKAVKYSYEKDKKGKWVKKPLH